MDAAGIKGRTRNPKRMLDDYLEEGDKPEEKKLPDFCLFTPYPRLRFSSRFSRWGSCLSTLCNNILYIMNTLQIILLWTKMSYFPTFPSSSFARRPKSVKQREQGQSP